MREYSIPHERRSGKISIPEESLERLREVRELHEEGLGTESVRKKLLRQEADLDVERLAERLDRITEALESSRSGLRPADEATSPQTLNVMLARQSLLISAVFNLTEMMEELLAAHGRPRRTTFDPFEGEIRSEALSPERPDRRLELVENGRAELPERRASASKPAGMIPELSPQSRFGNLSRKRRRNALAIVLVVLVTVTLAWASLTGNLPL